MKYLKWASIIAFAVFCAYWIKSNQLQQVAPSLSENYPAFYWIETHVKFILIFCILELIREVFFSFVRTLNVDKLARNLFVLLVIAFVPVFLTEFLSPLNWIQPLTNYPVGNGATVPMSATIYAQYYNAKLFSFSAFEHAYWGAAYRSLLGHFSAVLPITTFILNLPAIDVETYQALIFAMNSLYLIFCGFGFYLFLRKALRVDFLPALIGAILFVNANPFLAIMLAVDFPAFHTVLMILPWSLLFFHRSLEAPAMRVQISYAFLSGFALTIPFLFIAPHPEVVVHTMIFYAFYTVLVGLFKRDRSSFLRTPITFFFIFLSFVAFSAHFFFPIFQNLLTHQTTYFGHTGEMFRMEFNGSSDFLIPLFQHYGALSILILLMLPVLIFESATGCLLFLFFGFAYAFTLGKDGYFATELPAYTKAINFFTFYRAPALFSWAGLVLGICALDRAGKMRVRSLLGYALLGAIICAVWYLADSQDVWRSNARIVYTNFLQGGHFDVSGSWIANGSRDLFLLKFFLLSIAVIVITILSRHLRWKILRNSLGIAVIVMVFVMAKDLPTTELLKSGRFIDNPTGCSPAIFPETFSANLGKFKDDSASKRLAELQKINFAPDNCPGPNHWPTNMRVFDPNISAAFAGIKPYEQIFVLSNDELGAGGGPGFTVINSSSTVDTRFMMSDPMTHVIYVRPGEPFATLGTYGPPIAWRRTLVEALDPISRRIANISGVDYYIVKEQDLKGLSESLDLFEVKKVRLPKEIDRQLIQLRNKQSFGLTYMVEEIRKIPEDKKSEKDFYSYFKGWNLKKSRTDFENARLSLYAQLLASKKPFSALIEEKDLKTPSTIQLAAGANKAQTISYIDHHLATKVTCNQEPCILVANVSKNTGWRAFVDKESVEIKRANFAFMAVEVPKGDHLIWFEHRPFGAEIGFFVTLLAMLMLLFFVRRLWYIEA